MEIFKYKYDDLFNPILQALKQLGGSGTNVEIEEKLVKLLNLSNEEVEDIHRGSITKLTYRAAWAKNYLKRLGFIENSARAVWILTVKGREIRAIDKKQVKKAVKNLSDSNKSPARDEVIVDSVSEESEEITEIHWSDELIDLLKMLEPSAFERLSQRMLRELGFNNVEVTGKSGDGGIDGVGVIKLGGVLSFYVVFQCKRYAGSVSSSAIRDFRGAMIGRADKGLFITTGTFTRDALREAQRDGAPPIDLMDGKAFAENLRNLRLGVKIKIVEEVSIDREWFKDI